MTCSPASLWVLFSTIAFNIFSPSTSNLVLGHAVLVLSWAIRSNDWASSHFDARVFAWCWGGHMRMTRLSPRRFSRYWQTLADVKLYWVLLLNAKWLHKCLYVYRNTHRYEIVMSTPPMTRSASEICPSNSEWLPGYIMAWRNVSHTINSIMNRSPLQFSALHFCIQITTKS